MIEDVRSFLERNGLSQAMLSRSLGVSGSAISQYLKGGYKGDVKSLEGKLKAFISNYTPHKQASSMPFVETSNVRMAHFIINEAIVSRKMCAIYGEAGCGKSTMVHAFVREHPEAILIEAIPGMSLRTVLKEIGAQVGIDATGESSVMVRDIAKQLKLREAVIVVDEAENLTTGTLEAIRRIWDFSGTPTVLVGTYALLGNLKGRRGELLQLYSRIARKLEFSPLEDSEWEALFGEVWRDIVGVSKNMRVACNLYETAKRFATMKGEEIAAGHIKAVLPTMMIDE